MGSTRSSDERRRCATSRQPHTRRREADRRHDDQKGYAALRTISQRRPKECLGPDQAAHAAYADHRLAVFARRLSDILADVRLSLARRRDIRHRVTQADQGGESFKEQQSALIRPRGLLPQSWLQGSLCFRARRIISTKRVA